jgi:hypothetical protein
LEFINSKFNHDNSTIFKKIQIKNYKANTFLLICESDLNAEQIFNLLQDNEYFKVREVKNSEECLRYKIFSHI